MNSVSVILPFRNAEQTLADAIKSILDQSLNDFELLLVDNASTDGSSAIARSFAHTHDCIHIIEEAESGLVRALNTGLAHAKGKYIARMDADDIAYPDRLRLQYQYLEQNLSVDVIACKVVFDKDNYSKGIQAYVRWSNAIITHEEILLNRFVDSPVIHPSIMFRRSLLFRFGSYLEGDFPEDFELWLRWMDQGVRFYKLPEVLLYWRDSEERLTRNNQRYRSEAFYRTKTEYLFKWLQKNNPFHPQVVIWGGGRKSRQRARLLEDKGIEVSAYIDIVPNKTTSKPCIHYLDIENPGKYFILSYVSNRGQREKIRSYLLQKDYQEGIHFLLIG
ncbi:glycosyltransferase [Catalinimonas sp. 4WD22]|uniref:glycosyltransferase family 2 protein n=1 Tax=Catalinimonas locisalis TaxID=3133978 RepID=UPI003100BE75